MESPTDDNSHILSESSKDCSFYLQGKEYWSSIPATLNGMMGGFGNISQADIRGSNSFLRSIFKLDKAPGKERALDCGSGIGRITKNLLIKHFETVDLVDQNEEFIKKARDYVNSSRVGELYSCGLQDFKPEQKYDVIWVQWVLGHLTDVHFIEFMNNCKSGLKENGLIVVKENVTSSEDLELDSTDSSFTRSASHLTGLFEKAHLEEIHKADQRDFPKGLYPVKMYALRPLYYSDAISSDDSHR